MRPTQIRPPTLHPLQHQVRTSPARFKVLVCGRRWGKTRYGVAGEAIPRAVAGQRVWWVAPTWSQALIAWRLAKPMATQVPGVVVREAEHVLRFPGGGEVWFKSSDRPDNLRGEGLDFLILDEADFQDGDVWEQVLRPALADRRGGALFVSTPNVEGGWFHELFKRGQRGEPGWASWTFASETNPYVDPAEIAAARAQLPSIVARREFGAEFVSAGGARVNAAWLRRGEPPKGLALTMGVDLAISEKAGADYTAAVVMGRAADGRVWVVDAQRTRASFYQVLQFVQALAAKWRPASIAIESTQYQVAAVTELLRTTTLPVRGVKPDKDKLARFQPLEARYEQGLVWHADGLPADFERELLSFPVGAHDDFVDAAAYAYAALAAGPSVRLF
jgi:predicted phage terminase large subunit-like protein